MIALGATGSYGRGIGLITPGSGRVGSQWHTWIPLCLKGYSMTWIGSPVAPLFWVAKLATTAFGEAFSDFVLFDDYIGQHWAILIGLGVLIACLIACFATKRHTPVASCSKMFHRILSTMQFGAGPAGDDVRTPRITLRAGQLPRLAIVNLVDIGSPQCPGRTAATGHNAHESRERPPETADSRRHYSIVQQS